MENIKSQNVSKMFGSKKELEIIEKTSKMLSLHGDSQVVYITAEFAPFSNQQRPDIVYTPSLYNNVYFIEYKKTPLKGYSKNLFDELIEHKSFAEESLQQKIIYVFSTDKKLDLQMGATLDKNSFVILDQIEDEEDLYNAIINLVK